MRKYRISTFLILVLLISITSFSVQFTPELFSQLAGSKNKVPTISIPKYERIVLPNGMIVYIAEDHKLPIVEIKGYVKYGVLNESVETAGMSSFMLALMNSSTKNRDEFTLAEDKELNGVSISLSAKNDYYEISASALSEDVEALLEILADELMNPEFSGENFDRIRGEFLQNFAQAKTQEKGLANRYFYPALYGEAHPYSFSSNYDLLYMNFSKYSPSDLEMFYEKTISPNRLVLSIAGDFDKEKIKNLISAYFGNWNPTTTPDLTFKSEKYTPPYGKIFVVDRPSSTQAYLIMGYDFFDAKFPERIEFLMANRVYGSGAFNCRLMDMLRSKKGYVYGVSSAMQNYEVGGEYYVTTSVKYEAVSDTIKTIIEEMKAIKSGARPITDQELFDVINLYNAQFPDAYKDTISILDSVAFNVEIRKRSANYVNEFIQRYNSLKVDKANEVFSKYTYPEKFFVVLVGIKDKIIEDLKKNKIEGFEVIELK